MNELTDKVQLITAGLSQNGEENMLLGWKTMFQRSVCLNRNQILQQNSSIKCLQFNTDSVILLIK